MHAISKEENLIISTDNLIHIEHILSPSSNYEKYTHIHSKYELIFILEGRGKRYIMENSDDFESPYLILLNKNIRHYCKFDDLYAENLCGEAIIIYFDELLLEKLRFISDSSVFIDFIKNLKEYFIFDDITKLKIKPLFLALIDKKGFEKMSIILQIFHIISQCNNSLHHNRTFAVANNNTIQREENNTKRMANIIDFTRANFKTKISIENVASIANLSQTAFCRYFKKEKNKNYIDYVNEFRIMYASNLLKDTELSITQIAFESGFENISHFFNLFKKITKKTPLQYRKSYSDFFETEYCKNFFE